jgi:hypothetical protein
VPAKHRTVPSRLPRLMRFILAWHS